MALPEGRLEDVVRLVEAGMHTDFTAFRRTANRLAKEFAAAGYHDLARRMTSATRTQAAPLRASGQIETLPVEGRSRTPLIEELDPPTDALFVSEEIQQVLGEVLAHANNADRLAKAGLGAPITVLLHGPPGTGKTLFAQHVAQSLGRALYSVRLDAVVGSYLGETARNLRSIFDFRPASPSVLLLDEMDAIAKKRDDMHEVGELKRVVNSVIQAIDALDERAVLIAATNHPDLLDKAIWRRFTYKIEMPLPDTVTREKLWGEFLIDNETEDAVVSTLALVTQGFSGADIAEVARSEQRRALICDREPSVRTLLDEIRERRGEATIEPSGRRGTRETVLWLHDKGVPAVGIAKCLRVSRQAISEHLRERHAEAEA